jgi:hypothetical protein
MPARQRDSHRLLLKIAWEERANKDRHRLRLSTVGKASIGGIKEVVLLEEKDIFKSGNKTSGLTG